MASRQRIVTAFLDFTRDTTLAVQARERALLEQFVQGELTVEEVVAALRAILRTNLCQLRTQEQVVSMLVARGLLSRSPTPSPLPIAHRLLDRIG